jgi:hypothetical protein
VLFLAAAGGLVGFAGSLAGRPEEERLAAVFELAGAAGLVLAPAAAVVALYVHARLLLWSGKALRGQGGPVELRAALAWSSLPLLLSGWPHLLRKALHFAQLDRDHVSVWLLRASEVTDSLSDLSLAFGLVVGICSAVLYVAFLAEAQRFGVVRAIVNHLLAVLLLVALVGSGVALGYALRGSRPGIAAMAAAAAALVAWRIWLARRRPAVGPPLLSARQR